VRKVEGRGPLGKSRLKWEDIIKMVFKGTVRRSWNTLLCLRTGRDGLL
jgi:hypothetical protein